VDIDLTGFNEWMAEGIKKGWAGPPVCFTHDGLPLSEEEYDLDDSCIHILRLYDSVEQREKIIENHSPTTWRNTYTE